MFGVVMSQSLFQVESDISQTLLKLNKTQSVNNITDFPFSIAIFCLSYFHYYL